ncbi:hypothetical protein BFS30_08950 [Pedobacter steynii]|uniref:DUF1772 domain-containing protein n=2 Tax=Pedobacter steynii TaxID=430522 RepID=A0A1D7QF08_9SPHI|nr:hypothetical protein BFS30_08950 [Pedobacter steynii]
MKYKSVLLAMATISTALMAGLFFAFSVCINPAFMRLSDSEYILAMQEINLAIVNPIFVFVFIGSPLFLILTVMTYKKQFGSGKFNYLFVAAVLYVLGCFGVTVLGNIPLNNQLADFSLQGSSALQIKAMRAAFADAWNNWHTIRTIAAVLSSVILVLACIKKDPPLKGEG